MAKQHEYKANHSIRFGRSRTGINHQSTDGAPRRVGDDQRRVGRVPDAVEAVDGQPVPVAQEIGDVAARVRGQRRVLGQVREVHQRPPDAARPRRRRNPAHVYKTLFLPRLTNVFSSPWLVAGQRQSNSTVEVCCGGTLRSGRVCM